MNRYASLLYKRGFLLTDIKSPVFNDSDSQEVFLKWHCLDIGKYKLFHDPDLSVASAQDDRNMMVVLGLVLNPFEETSDPHRITARLLSYKSRSEAGFIYYLNQLSGRFVILSKQGDKIEIFNDACATRTVFFDRFNEQTVVSSHASLIADLMNYEISDEANYFFYNKEYSNELMKKLPGIMSPYLSVNLLTPNTKLILPEKRVERFFPNKENQQFEDYDDLVDQLAWLMSMEVRLLSAKSRMALSLTAGLDSRTSLAAAKPFAGDIEYFTYLTRNKAHVEDVRTASEICEDLYLPHRVYKWESGYYKGMKDFKTVWLKNLGIGRGIMWLNKIYADSYPKERIHIRSNLAEIIKSALPLARFKSLTPEHLAYLYTVTPMNRDKKIINKFGEFIETTDFSEDHFYNYNFRDLFEWEYCMPQWHSWLILESDMSHDTFLIYNNRELLCRMLALPLNARLNKKVFIEIIRRLWPELLRYPVNGKIIV